MKAILNFSFSFFSFLPGNGSIQNLQSPSIVKLKLEFIIRQNLNLKKYYTIPRSNIIKIRIKQNSLVPFHEKKKKKGETKETRSQSSLLYIITDIIPVNFTFFPDRISEYSTSRPPNCATRNFSEFETERVTRH